MKKIRTSFVFKVITVYLALNIAFPLAGIQIGIQRSYALTGGPSQPEFNSFTPIGTSDMVDLASGDFNYNIPIMDVGGYPLNLSYNSGITMDQEASWVGLGWNLNVGQINRNVRGLPDDFDGDKMIYENNLKKNITVGVGIDINAQLAGIEAPSVNAGMSIQYNNYNGISFTSSYGISFALSDNVTVGMNLSSSTGEGVNVSPNVGFQFKSDKTNKSALKINSGIGVSYNTRQGLTNFNMSTSVGTAFQRKNEKGEKEGSYFKTGASGSGSLSFVNNTVTPTKRFAMTNANFNFNFSLGLDFWSIDGEGGVSAFGNYQGILHPVKEERAYGYQNTEHATKNDILDFNRENDRAFNKNTLVLPTTNYTYDLYAIQGQGIGGMFRPFRSQVQYVYDRYVEDKGDGGSLGVEIEGASGFHGGGKFVWSHTKSHTGVWETPATAFFKQKTKNLNLDYENVYFKSIGEFTVDKEQNILDDILRGTSPIAIKILGNTSSIGKYGANIYREKTLSPDGKHVYTDTQINDKIARNKRELRNLAIQKITAKESLLDKTITKNKNSKPHHTAGYKILKNDGSTYIYGETAYNIRKEETTFAVNNQGDCTTGIVTYKGAENSINNSSGNDHYFNNIITPSYAHTYLLSAILSSDYEDVNGNGVDDADLGSYTKFIYKDYPVYKWRVPFAQKSATYNAGLFTLKHDQKGSYVYGKKELKYIKKIETKTHIAIFYLDGRKDALGVKNKDGGKNTNSRMQKLDSIKLFSKTDFIKNGDAKAIPIKTAHFEYDYALCKGVPNHDNYGTNVDDGKLTLNKIYFTYANSKMGKHTPYVFNYNGLNPDYNLKGYDIWGNYKPNVGGCGYDDETTSAEFPYVNQSNKAVQDDYASSWSMTSIDLPSGGKIELEYEADDYQFVQRKKAMQMYKVVGVSGSATPTSIASVKNTLYNPGPLFNVSASEAKYVVVEIKDGVTLNEFKEDYIGNHWEKPIFFRFLLNMTKDDYEYVEGYFLIDHGKQITTFSDGGKNYGAIPMQFVDLEGGVNGNSQINPISKAGWYFGRNQLNRAVFGLNQDPNSENIKTIARKIGGTTSLSMLEEILHGANELLRNKKLCARKFKPRKSWIRLLKPGNKLGGGVRIKKLKMHDNWDAMTVDANGNPNVNNPNNIYKQFYGQEYSYKLEDGKSSGVATFEPNVSKENPFIEPHYDSADRILAPREVSYVEKPFGVSFFPSAKVTYSRVEVKNLERKNDTEVVKNNATGKVVNTFYTSYDFPTKADFTDIDKPKNWVSIPDRDHLYENIIKGILGMKITTNVEMTYSQGFVVQTNDMDGKTRKQEVYNEEGDFISGVEYKYSVKEDESKLDNKLPVIDALGNISKKEIATHYDVINDFRESYSNTRVNGLSANLAVFALGIIPVIIPMGQPERADHTNIMHTVTTTKVIHSTGILKEKIATDLGAKVATENLAWDAITGQVLVTKTKNEYNDAYYSINYPAHWKYKQMGLASNNINLSGVLTPTTTSNFTLNNAKDYLLEGDELYLEYVDADNENVVEKFWVSKVTNNNVTLMDKYGKVLNGNNPILSSKYSVPNTAKFKVIRSGYRNLQSASMASVTTMTNPIYNNQVPATLKPKLTAQNTKIVNASAIEYTDLWSPQCECLGIPSFAYNFNGNGDLVDENGNAYTDTNPLGNTFAAIKGDSLNHFNPYLYNVKGNFKAVRSYAYLTERNANINDASPRNDGFFIEFEPYYITTGIGNNTHWIKNPTADSKWTFASKVSMYSPYGVELENKDALGRYSSAQYGFNYTLPTAVSSNSKYTDMGYDSFEDYQSNKDCTTTHFAYRKALSNDIGNAAITNKESHTGHNAIKVKGGTSATLEKRIENCN